MHPHRKPLSARMLVAKQCKYVAQIHFEKIHHTVMMNRGTELYNSVMARTNDQVDVCMKLRCKQRRKAKYKKKTKQTNKTTT